MWQCGYTAVNKGQEDKLVGYIFGLSLGFRVSGKSPNFFTHLWIKSHHIAQENTQSKQ